MKIVTVVGARPQFIKAAVVSTVLRDAGIKEVLLHTGQHYDDNMSAVFFRELELCDPDYNLCIGSGSHGSQTGKMIQEIESVLLKERPDLVLIYGDTNSTLAGALAAVKLHIPVAHVEAGLRSFNRGMPEEINRILSDQISSLLFVPTPSASLNLQREGVSSEKIHLVGDVMYDCAIRFGKGSSQALLDRFGLESKKYVLVTIHRAENTDNTEKLDIIVQALGELSRHESVLFPIHPRTFKKLQSRAEWMTCLSNVRLVDPLGYVDMGCAEREAKVVLTDSGGVQKEAFFYRTPCVTVRDETEWTELIDLGWNRLSPPVDSSSIVSSVLGAMPGVEPSSEIYGGGRAAERIGQVLARECV